MKRPPLRFGDVVVIDGDGDPLVYVRDSTLPGDHVILAHGDGHLSYHRDRVTLAPDTARAKDAELIQRLVDALVYTQGHGRSFTSPMEPEALARYERINTAMNAAKAAGFTPSDR